MNAFLRFYHTIKYLKFVQVLNRISRRFRKVKFDFKKLSELSVCETSADWYSYPILDSCYLGNGRFKFLNLIDTVTDWNDKDKEKLWLYNLHYFDDLNRSGWHEREAIHNSMIYSWINQNQIMTGNGWEPYTLSLRIVNWIKWFLSRDKVDDEWLFSLALQVQALEQQIEYHLLGNHIFSNAKALVFAGCFFEGKLSERWLKKGFEILDKEMHEQILPDGGHFELSPMYHNIILVDVLDLYQLSHVYPDKITSTKSNYWKVLAEKMLSWADFMQHPDGDISFFNDAAIGIAPNLSSIDGYAKFLNINTSFNNVRYINLLKSSGYIVINNNAYKLIIDAAKVGPDYIPGHSHADTLSFELSVEGYRVFVNSGTSLYGVSDERLRQRKTESHNTVVVDEQDSSEVWSGFRVARRAYPTNPIIRSNNEVTDIECAHDGYVRLPGKVIHTRSWKLTHDCFIVHDNLSGDFNRASAYYHLHPNIQIDESIHKEEIIIQLPNHSQYKISAKGADINVSDTTWHPEFGLSVANKKITLKFKTRDVFLIMKRVF